MVSLKLYDIVKNLLNEDASNNINSYDVDMKIKYAITNRKYISLYYDDKKGKMIGSKGNPKGFRRIIPYCYGSRKGRPALRCFHVYKTNTKRGPFKWKYFYVDNITNLRVYDSWPSFSQKNVPQNFNPNGDKHMDEIYAIVDFGYESPLNKASTSNSKNVKGSIKNVNSLSNLMQYKDPNAKFKNGKVNYGTVKANVDKRNVEMTQGDRENYWKDYEKAEGELNAQNQASTHGPIGKVNNSYDEDFYDVNDVDFNENNFLR